MTQEAGPTKQMVAVKCEKHGLRYNPNTHTGCVRCRKEAGETIGTAPPQPASPTPPTAAVAAGVIPTRTTQARLMPSLAVTAILIGLTGGTLFLAHSMLASKIEQMGFDPDSFDPDSFDPDGFYPDDYDPDDYDPDDYDPDEEDD